MCAGKSLSQQQTRQSDQPRTIMADTTVMAEHAKVLTVNGDAMESSAANLSDLLAELGYGDAKVATAVNGDFIAADGRADCSLQSNDRIEIVAPRQGG